MEKVLSSLQQHHNWALISSLLLDMVQCHIFEENVFFMCIILHLIYIFNNSCHDSEMNDFRVRDKARYSKIGHLTGRIRAFAKTYQYFYVRKDENRSLADSYFPASRNTDSFCQWLIFCNDRLIGRLIGVVAIEQT